MTPLWVASAPVHFRADDTASPGAPAFHSAFFIPLHDIPIRREQFAMQFDRDEFLLLSRRGNVPGTRSPSPRSGPRNPRRNRHVPKARVKLRSLSKALTASRAVQRTAARGVQGYRRDR